MVQVAHTAEIRGPQLVPTVLSLPAPSRRERESKAPAERRGRLEQRFAQASGLRIVRPALSAVLARGGENAGQGAAMQNRAQPANGVRAVLHPVEDVLRLRESGPAAEQSSAEIARAKALETLAREFHDGILQNLVFLDLELSALRAPAEQQSEELATRLPTLQQVVQESIRELRTMLGGMRAQQKPCACLQDLLLERVRGFNTITRSSVTLVMRNCPQPVCAPAPIGHDIDLIVHEALCNAWKHSGAHSITVALCKEQAGMKVQVSDNGRGFDPSLPRPGHFGLQSMEERAAGVGGQLELVSAPGRGTTVKLFVPARLLSVTAG